MIPYGNCCATGFPHGEALTVIALSLIKPITKRENWVANYKALYVISTWNPSCRFFELQLLWKVHFLMWLAPCVLNGFLIQWFASCLAWRLGNVSFWVKVGLALEQLEPNFSSFFSACYSEEQPGQNLEHRQFRCYVNFILSLKSYNKEKQASLLAVCLTHSDYLDPQIHKVLCISKLSFFVRVVRSAGCK